MVAGFAPTADRYFNKIRVQAANAGTTRAYGKITVTIDMPSGVSVAATGIWLIDDLS